MCSLTPQIAGTWDAIWCSSTSLGWVYSAILKLELKDGKVTGENRWTVVKSPYPWARKTATEFLSGTYDPGSRTVELEGTSKDDPEGVIGLDAYRLTLSEDGRSLSGNTRSHGTWKVRIMVAM